MDLSDYQEKKKEKNLTFMSLESQKERKQDRVEKVLKRNNG